MLPDFKYIWNTVSYNNKLYFVSGNYDDLIEIDVENNWKLRSVCRFPWIQPKGTVECIIDGTKIWCVATQGSQIASYDFADNHMEYYSKKECTRENMGSIYCQGVIWIFPRDLPDSLIGFSTVDKTFFTNESWEACCISEQVSGRIGVCSTNKEEAILVLKNRKNFIQYNLTENSMKIFELPIAEKLYGVVRIGESLYFTVADSKKVYVLNPLSEEIQEYKSLDGNEGQYYIPINIDGKLLLCDGYKLSVFDNGSFRELGFGKTEKPMRSFFLSALKSGEKYYFLPWSGDWALETDSNFEHANIHTLPYSVEPVEDWISRTKIIRENDISLSEYLTAISNMKDKDMEGDGQCATIGEAIYRACL